MSSPKFKEVVTLAGEEETNKAITKAKIDMSRLSSKAVKVVEKAMESYLTGDGSAREAIGAAQMVLKASGIHETEEKAQDSTINIIMPTGTEPVTYEYKDAADDNAT
jgi:hypothetical protein